MVHDPNEIMLLFKAMSFLSKKVKYLIRLVSVW